VAGLVAILSRVSTVDPVAAFRNGLILIIAFFAAAGAVSAVLLTARAATATGPAAPPTPAARDGGTAAPVPVTVQTQDR